MKTNDDYANALHEVMQQIALAGLHRGGFFDKAAFYGGTCLRIFHGMQRFSEDMDFSLLKEDVAFSLEHYFDAITAEFKALGRDIIISKKQKARRTNVESAFLKDDTAVYDLRFKKEHDIKIKLEVDIHPPPGFSTEQKLLLLPFSFMTRCYSLPDLYAGKMHALMFRTWKNRVKGRDWYDFEWYVRNGIKLHFEHFRQRAYQFGSLKKGELTKQSFKRLLKEKIAATNIDTVKADVRPFIKDTKVMDIWSVDYFSRLADMIEFQDATGGKK
nr:nucleotidyl transferase AbiEii/AbiGii toxin family protein [Ereboglobus luteus]